MLEIYRSEVVKKNLNPTFKRFSLNAAILCNCNRDMPLLWQVKDWNKNGEEKFIGQFEASLNTIMDSSSKEFDLIYEKKQKKHKDYVNSGVFTFQECTLNVPAEEEKLPPSFYDFISTGTGKLIIILFIKKNYFSLYFHYIFIILYYIIFCFILFYF